MPTGGGLMAGGDPTELASAVTPNNIGAGAGSASSATQWMPIFQLGTGNPGVPSDARALISGMGAATAQQGNQQATANAAQTALSAGIGANAGTTSSGSSTGAAGPSGGAASSNDGSLPADPNINNPGGETAQQNQDYLNSLGSGGG
jgi:hypothetical protein